MSFVINETSAKNDFNASMILITMGSTVISFIVALQWQKFFEDVIDDVKKKTKAPLPRSVEALISAVIITGIGVGLAYVLYKAAQKHVK